MSMNETLSFREKQELLDFIEDWKAFPQIKLRFMDWSNAKILYCIASLDREKLIETDYKLAPNPNPHYRKARTIQRVWKAFGTSTQKKIGETA